MNPNGLPTITIVMTTFFPDGSVGDARLASAKRALDSWLSYLRYDGRMALHIADDSPGGAAWQARVNALAKQWQDAALMRLRPPVDESLREEVTVSHQSGGGVGASLNRGFTLAWQVSPLALYAVDDWALTHHLSLTPWARLLLRDETVGMVRLGPPHPDLTGTVKHIPEGWMLALDRHHFAFATRPALYHQRLMASVGAFEEGVDAYRAEWAYNARWVAAEHPRIVLALPDAWEHVGTVEVGDLAPVRGTL